MSFSVSCSPVTHRPRVLAPDWSERRVQPGLEFVQNFAVWLLFSKMEAKVSSEIVVMWLLLSGEISVRCKNTACAG